MNFGFCPKHGQKLLLGTFGLLLPILVPAAEWKFSPSADLTETYTDNVAFNAGSGAESEWITQINPGLSIAGTGKELDLSLRYRLQNLVYANNSGRNSSYQQLQSTVKATVLPQYAFIDASASISQQVLTPEDNVSVGNIGVLGSRSNVETSRISPYLRARLGSQLETEARYSYDSVQYDKSGVGNNVSDSTSDGVSLYLRSVQNTGSWNWGLNFRQSNIDYKNRSDEKREDTSANFTYRMDSRLALLATGGYQNNEYSSGTSVPQGSYWSLGFNWQPSSRTALTLNAGERYYGRTGTLKFSHKARRNDIELGYVESLSSRRLLQLEQQEISIFNADGSPFIDPISGQQFLMNVPLLVTFEQVFVSKRANARWGFRTRKTTTQINILSERRTYQDNGEEDRIKSSNLSWNWQMNRSSQFSANASWRNTQRVTGDDNYKVVTMAFSRTISRDAVGSISLRRLQRTASNTVDYAVNTVSASLRMNW